MGGGEGVGDSPVCVCGGVVCLNLVDMPMYIITLCHISVEVTKISYIIFSPSLSLPMHLSHFPFSSLLLTFQCLVTQLCLFIRLSWFFMFNQELSRFHQAMQKAITHKV